MGPPRRNIFILGLNDFLRGELESIRDADRYRFHDLVGMDALMDRANCTFSELLDRARGELDDFDGSVDAVLAHWDFPTSVLAPILAREHAVPAPSLESVLACEHKFWSRCQQAASVPECVPGFSAFDPFGADPGSGIELDYPFWVKPVKAFSSKLGFRIEDRHQLGDAVAEIRRDIGELADPFDEALAMAELPPAIRDAPGSTCLAEEIITGIQAAPEGSVFRGRVDVHGTFDMHKDERNETIEALDYPASAVPDEVEQRMADVAKRYLQHIGYDDGCFNVEYMWEPETDQLRIIEVNTRISQSHSDLFAKVDGRTNHEIAIDVAVGQEPRLPDQAGSFRVASKCMLLEPDDGIVTRVPDDDDLAAIAERFPETIVQLQVEPGQRLSDLPDQDSYSYRLGHAYIGGDDRADLDQRREACLAQLREMITVEPIDSADGIPA